MFGRTFGFCSCRYRAFYYDFSMNSRIFIVLRIWFCYDDSNSKMQRNGVVNMEIVRKNRAYKLKLWGTENMLEYFQSMRDMSYGDFLIEYGFSPLHISIVESSENRRVVVDLYSNMTEKLNEVVELLESLDEPYHWWGNALSVYADEFERELSIHIDASVPVDEIHTHVKISEPTNYFDKSLLWFARDTFEDEVRDNVNAVVSYSGTGVRHDSLALLDQLVVLRGYFVNAFVNGQLKLLDGTTSGKFDGNVYFYDDGGFGSEWPERGLEGYIAFPVRGVFDISESYLEDWTFWLTLMDTDTRDKLTYRCDLYLNYEGDDYVVWEDFLHGEIDEPDWWATCFKD